MPTALPPSIFNDVLGPVMRGPSSSHSAASVRIGRLARDLIGGGDAERVLIEFDTGGSLATTHESQGTDMGLFGGLLGWEADDERLPNSAEALRAAGVDAIIRCAALGDPHPNTYRLTLWHGGAETRLVAISIGGGMIELLEVDGFAVGPLRGDYVVTLLDLPDTVAASDVAGLRDGLAANPAVDAVALAGEGPWLLAVSAQRPLADTPAAATRVRVLQPVLPVWSRRDLTVPFLHAGELAEQVDLETTRLSDHALAYEAARGAIDESAVLDKLRHLVQIMRSGVEKGLAGTEYEDRILGYQCGTFVERWQSGQLLDGGVLNRMIAYVTALMEAKSSMQVIIAAPTAGSCATFPGATLAAADDLGTDEATLLRAAASAGLIGVFVATRSSFAAEVGGCQAETGAGAAMGAAALVELMGGTAAQALSAASHALQNVLGLICDPVANRVEAPCLGRNVVGAANALTAANMALAGYDHLIPLDQVLDAHREVSERMARELRCTALGGLSITPKSREIEAKLAGGCGC